MGGVASFASWDCYSCASFLPCNPPCFVSLGRLTLQGLPPSAASPPPRSRPCRTLWSPPTPPAATAAAATGAAMTALVRRHVPRAAALRLRQPASAATGPPLLARAARGASSRLQATRRWGVVPCAWRIFARGSEPGRSECLTCSEREVVGESGRAHACKQLARDCSLYTHECVVEHHGMQYPQLGLCWAQCGRAAEPAACLPPATRRLLPDCRHSFHAACIDPWLRSKPACPVCRTVVVATP